VAERGLTDIVSVRGFLSTVEDYKKEASMKSLLRSSIAMLFILLSACAPVTSTAVTPTPQATLEQAPPQDTPTPAPLLTVKVLTYNTLYGAGVDRSRDNSIPVRMQGLDRSPLLMKYLKDVDADVIGLQEIVGWQKGSPPFIEKLASELGMNYFLAKSDLTDATVALLTKYEIAEAEDYSNEMGYEGSLRAKLITPDGAPLNVFVAHLDGSSQTSRLCATQFLIAKMQPYIQQRTILMGDMNFRGDSPEHDLLVEAGWNRVITEPRLGIDQIWISPSVEWTGGAWRTVATDARKISDHFPIGEILNIFSSSGNMLAVATPTATETKSLPDLPPVVSDSLISPTVLKSASFDSICSQQQWTASWDYQKIAEGRLEVTGVQDWQSGAYYNASVSEGNAFLLSFLYTQGSEFNIFLENGNWADPAYRRFGVYYNSNNFSSDMWKGETPVGGDNWNIQADADTWYNLLLIVDKDAHFTGILWNPAYPSNVAVYRREMGTDWSNLPWRLSIGANQGQVQIKDSFLIQHDGFK
jgi:endonuclease/exonuclease/phosphatase family metal-dependent hydrolase